MFTDIQHLRAIALRKAQEFIGSTHPLAELGWGIGGFVFKSPDFLTAIKVHHRSESYATEIAAYERLRKHRVTSLFGLTIPRLVNSDQVLELIQMDLVSPPYLLDFAGVSFKKPDFSAETMAATFKEVDRLFGQNAHIAHDVYHALAKIGMYYLDFRPSNLNLKGLPGIDLSPEPDEPDDDAF